MSDIPTVVFGPLQEDIDIVFGETIGMLLGHLLIIAIIAIIVVAFQNRRHVYEKSGFDKNAAIDIFSILLLSDLSDRSSPDSVSPLIVINLPDSKIS